MHIKYETLQFLLILYYFTPNFNLVDLPETKNSKNTVGTLLIEH